MKLGAMKAQLPWSLEETDLAFCYSGGLTWDAQEALAPRGRLAFVSDKLDELVQTRRCRGAAGRSRAVHEQRRLRRHPRQAARRAGCQRS